MKRNRDKIWEHLADVNPYELPLKEIPFNELLEDELIIEKLNEVNFSLYEHLIGTQEAIEKAIEVAEDLGFCSEYMDGCTISHEQHMGMKNLINFLVGTPWPEEVKAAYQSGVDLGFWET